MSDTNTIESTKVTSVNEVKGSPKDPNTLVIISEVNSQKKDTRHSDMDCMLQLFKTYCKIGFMTFGVVFVANVIKLITGRIVPAELLFKMGPRDFLGVFIGIFISSAGFGLAWPNIPFRLLAQKNQLTSLKK